MRQILPHTDTHKKTAWHWNSHPSTSPRLLGPVVWHLTTVSRIHCRHLEAPNAEDLERRRLPGEDVEDKDVLAARLLDLKKAYPRVNKPALWRILERLGLDGNFLWSLKNLHETTEYKVPGQDGFSEIWVPDRGLREGCPSSPPCFNIFHQAVMRRAVRWRGRRGRRRPVWWLGWW